MVGGIVVVGRAGGGSGSGRGGVGRGIVKEQTCGGC